MHKIVKQVYDDLGPVGGIVCNAGRANQKPALEAKREDFDACFDTNVWGAFVCAQACAALWKEHGYQNGKIVIVSCESGSRDMVESLLKIVELTRTDCSDRSQPSPDRSPTRAPSNASTTLPREPSTSSPSVSLWNGPTWGSTSTASVPDTSRRT